MAGPFNEQFGAFSKADASLTLFPDSFDSPFIIGGVAGYSNNRAWLVVVTGLVRQGVICRRVEEVDMEGRAEGLSSWGVEADSMRINDLGNSVLGMLPIELLALAVRNNMLQVKPDLVANLVDWGFLAVPVGLAFHLLLGICHACMGYCGGITELADDSFCTT